MTLPRIHNDNGGGQGVLTDDELTDIQSLFRYLSQAMTIPLSEHGNREKYLDESGFILTLDYTMKLLRVHERVVCRTPCIVEGETGVSKTALTKMYSMLRNETVQKCALESDLEDMEKQLGSYFVEYTGGGGVLEGISSTLSSDSQDHAELFEVARNWLMDRLDGRPSIFAELPADLRKPPSCAEELVAGLTWFEEAHLEGMFGSSR